MSYQAFDLVEAGPERIGEILAEVLDLFARGVLTRAAGAGLGRWTRPAEALRFMGQGRHTGKNVVRMPGAAGRVRDGAGHRGAGVLGGLMARHLAETRAGRAAGAGLAARPGRAGGGAAGRASWPALGAEVQVAACDAGGPGGAGRRAGAGPGRRTR